MAEPKGSLADPPTPSQRGENVSVFPGLRSGCWESEVLGWVMADSNRPVVRQVLAVTDPGSCSVAIVPSFSPVLMGAGLGSQLHGGAMCEFWLQRHK